MFRAIFHYEGNSSFDIDGITFWGESIGWNSIDQFCVPQNHFYWASQTGTYECTDLTDQLTIYNSMTLVIYYGYRSFFIGKRYNGGVFTAPIKYINITARGRTKDCTEEAVLTLYWNWHIYRCSILFNDNTTSYSCGGAELNLTTNNCSEYAFAVGLEIHDGVIPYIDSISITDEDSNTQIMNETISTNESSIIVDFSTVWSGTTIDIYNREVNSMCFLATGSLTLLLSTLTFLRLLCDDVCLTDVPTNAPSNAPSVAPSQSPTQHPIIYSDFQFEISAGFRITGWTDSEISEVNHDTELFLTSMTTYIHQGFDDDYHLEYRAVVLNVTDITDNFYDDLSTDDHSAMDETIHDYNMDLQYLIECRNVDICRYISGENATVQLDRSEFELFVTNRLNSNFSSDSLLFTVMNMTMRIDIDEIHENEGISVFVIILGISGALCLFISGISIGVILYHRKRHRSTDNLCIRNALVAMISIGDYANGANISRRDKDVQGMYQNLPVEKDAETLQNLCKYMNWTFISKREEVDTHWTEKEVMTFLQRDIGQVMFDNDGESNFDGLIVCVSCHGMKDKIVTSDMKTIERTVIHRTLSLKYPQLRDIPRIFVFDCCDGWDERRASIPVAQEIAKDIELVMTDEGQSRKGTNLDDVQNMSTNAWTSTTKNPDYNMVTVYAANSGFVAKMNYNGSYLVYSLTDAIMENVERKQEKTLAEMLEDVQNRLHDAGRQLPVSILNNHTRSLVFQMNVQK